MKFRGTIEFIIILIVILLLYFAFITNIDYITMSYHGKLDEYKNVYYKETLEPNILYELRELVGEKHEIPAQGIALIKNNKIVKNILKEFVGISEAGIEKYIQQLKSDEKINFIKENIIYILEDKYEMAFSMDMKHIVYQQKLFNEELIDWDNRSITIENKYTIYERVSKQLQKLGITEKFNFAPETIYFQYAIEGDIDSDVYAIEDNKSNIKIVVARPDYQIEKLQIGFTESILDG